LHTSVSRLRRLAVACRFASIFTVCSIASPFAASGADTITGQVVDQSGRSLPRAYVRELASSGVELTSTFTDEAGRFSVPAGDHCDLQVSMSGFEPASAPCASTPPLKIVLHVAPVQETVVVSATRTAVPADQVGASVTTFTASDLESRREPMVADLLRSTPGVMVVRTGGVGAVTSLFVRGGESNYNKVLLDGIPLNEPGGTFNFSNLTTDGLERIEIVRGSQSALFGSDAMSSVVQLFTKRPDRASGQPHVTASFEGGTYGTARGGASVSGASPRFDYSFGASRYNTDNNVPNDRFGNTTLSASLGVVLSDTATLRFVGRGELERTGTPGQTAFARPDLDAFFTRHDGVGGITFDQQVTAAFRQRASYSLAVSNQRSADLIEDPPYTPQFGDRVAPFAFSDFTFDSRTNLQRHHASYQADWRLTTDASSFGDHRLTVLGDWDGERATLADALAGTSLPASRNNVGATIQHQALWPRTFVTVSARLEHNDSFGTAVVPRGSVVYIAHAGTGTVGETTLKASAGLGIKEPTLLQSFSPSPFYLGNPDLQPERARTVDAGIEQRLLGDRAKIELTWFDNRYRNIISTRTTDPVTFSAQYFNIGLTQARGAELGVELVPVRTVHVRGGYTFVDSEILDSTSPLNVVFQPGQWAFRRPRHSGYVGVAWAWQRVTAGVNGVIIGRFVDSDFSSFEPPLLSNRGYETWDARVSYDVTKQLRLLASIDNVANAQYMESLGYPALGRAVRGGLRVGF
jgi:vitamin B12 transporter